MLKQLMRHRWICFVHGGLTLLLGLGLVGLRPMLEDRVLGTFIAVVLLLSTGFVLVAAGLLDLVIALDVTANERRLRSALMWWVPGIIGIGMGLAILLTPRVTLCQLAMMAAGHAMVMTAFGLAMLPGLNRHPRQRNLLLISSFLFVIFGVLLVSGALGTEAMATGAIGLYALYFGIRLMFLGGQLATESHSPVAVS
jgi:hypothetical protein